MTPPKVVRIRPTSHKFLGWALVAVGLIVAVMNDLAYIGTNVMPGGHNELYLLAAIAIAGFGSRWLGIFDRPA